MLKEEEIKYIETKIKKTIEVIENTYYYEYVNYELSQDEEEYPGFTRYWISEKIKGLYNLIKVYIEVKGLDIFLQDFTTKFDKLINNPKTDLLEYEETHPEAEHSLKFLNNFKDTLNVFMFFDNLEEQKLESHKITSILKHTDYILKNINTQVNNEADIYKQIKWILGLYFPKCRLVQKASFIQEFKTYNPDILIPELRTAIEYKYVKTKTANIDEYIDQIRIDATNYTGDSRYETFIAVLYIKDTSIATHESIQASWDQKKFPRNWDLVIAMGSK